MRHGIQKTKFGAGKDANDMLLRKLAYNFFTHGSIKTTERKAKVLKQHIDRLVEKMKEKTEANKNVLMKYLASDELVNQLFEQIPAAIGDTKGGYTRIEKLQIRYSDGAPMARLLWSKPVVVEAKPVKEEEKKKAKPAAKTKEKKETK